MWIRSQDKKQLVECKSFELGTNIGKKDSAIVGYISNGFWGRKAIILGLYDTKEIAISELTRLQSEVENNVKVYEMS